jgi:DNA-directed RNA polymerase subunit RPC12/RpoP
MRARCGRCGVEVEIPGPGTFVCPACGTQNQVRAPEGTGPGPGTDTAPGGLTVPSRPGSAGENTTKRVTCGECSFSFAVGDIEVATCPNCRAEVPVKAKGAS